MDELQKWFIEHASDDTQDDYLLSSEGFERFNAQVRQEYPWQRRCMHIVQRVAAILLIPVAVATVYFASRKPAQVQWNEVYTQSGQTRNVSLADGSVIRLAPESRLTYPSSFGSDLRRVFLEGEAYASITHNDKCPFEIQSNDVTVRVLGTEFNFSSYSSDAECELALVDGSVEMNIEGANGNHKIQMKTGDMVRYDKETGSLDNLRFSPDAFLANARKGGLQFSNRKMEDIARCLERQFGARIIIEDDAIAEERYFASFINGEDLPSILRSLNTQNHMNINKKGDIYYLSLK